MSLKKKSWLAIIATAVATFNSGALFFGYPGVMTKYWGDMFNADAMARGFVMTFACVGVGLLMLLSGSIHARIGTRKCLLIGTVILIGAMVIANFATSMWHAYLWAFLCGAGNGFVYGPCVSTSQQWMPSRRGLAAGIVNLTFGTAGAIMSLAYNAMLHDPAIGYRTMNWIIIGMIVVLNVLAAIFAEIPAFARLTPDQANELEAQKAAAAESRSQALASRSYTVKEALKSGNFWLMWLAWVFMGAAGISMVSLAKSYESFLTGTATTAIVLTAFNLTNGIGRIVAGTLSDIIGRNLTGFLVLALGGIGYFCLPFFGSIPPVAVFAAFVGFAFGTLFTITAPLVSDLFGLEHYSMIFSLVFTAYGFISGVAGPLLTGWILDNTDNNYSLVFRLLSLFCIIGAFCVLFARRKKT
ncbi:MAG: OFA family MFS transporter [Lachnospiraceae bacterium]|nr:OFA family MFS transporter [Lachnospiraceae bacterium]